MRLRILLVVLGLLSVGSACQGSDDGLGLVRVDRPMPALAGTTVQGAEISPSDYAGHVTVVNFWATWCGPCEAEQPALQQVWSQYRDRGVEFVGVDYRDDNAAAAAWVDRFGVTYPSVADAPGGWADDFSLRGAPTTYVADASGRIRFQISGATTVDELSSVLDELLAAPSS